MGRRLTAESINPWCEGEIRAAKEDVVQTGDYSPGHFGPSRPPRSSRFTRAGTTGGTPASSLSVRSVRFPRRLEGGRHLALSCRYSASGGLKPIGFLVIIVNSPEQVEQRRGRINSLEQRPCPNLLLHTDASRNLSRLHGHHGYSKTDNIAGELTDVSNDNVHDGPSLMFNSPTPMNFLLSRNFTDTLS